MTKIRIADNDDGKITATADGETVRVWYYDAYSHGVQMPKAREFAEGWFQAFKWMEATAEEHKEPPGAPGGQSGEDALRQQMAEARKLK